MQLKPLANRIIVQPLEADDKTPGGILLPDSAKEKPRRGKVISIGTGRLLDNGNMVPINVKVDDLVVYNHYSGNEVKLGANEYLILDADSVLATIY